MRERAEMLGGTLVIHAEPGNGTVVRATGRWPLAIMALFADKRWPSPASRGGDKGSGADRPSLQRAV
jgi:hypothetical protein